MLDVGDGQTSGRLLRPVPPPLERERERDTTGDDLADDLLQEEGDANELELEEGDDLDASCRRGAFFHDDALRAFDVLTLDWETPARNDSDAGLCEDRAGAAPVCIVRWGAFRLLPGFWHRSTYVSPPPESAKVRWASVPCPAVACHGRPGRRC